MPAYVEERLDGRRRPIIASTDCIRAFADQIRQWVPSSYRVLGTDGFGPSDCRQALPRFFEVDRHYVAVAALDLNRWRMQARSTPLMCRRRSSATRSTLTRRRPPLSDPATVVIGVPVAGFIGDPDKAVDA